MSAGRCPLAATFGTFALLDVFDRSLDSIESDFEDTDEMEERVAEINAVMNRIECFVQAYCASGAPLQNAQQRVASGAATRQIPQGEDQTAVREWTGPARSLVVKRVFEQAWSVRAPSAALGITDRRGRECLRSVGWSRNNVLKTQQVDRASSVSDTQRQRVCIEHDVTCGKYLTDIDGVRAAVAIVWIA